MRAAIIVSTTSHFIVKRANNWKRECAQSFEKSRKDSKFKQEEKKKSPKILDCFKRLRRENVPKNTFLATHGSINFIIFKQARSKGQTYRARAQICYFPNLKIFLYFFTIWVRYPKPKAESDFTIHNNKFLGEKIPGFTKNCLVKPGNRGNLDYR